ncbi:hypothetical protein Q3G72_005962 [Acer saccharum]|nr:hypothetical protein Q3G72_005962 [Acer saccharum]
MQTLNMMKRKRVQVGDTQPLSGRGAVHVSNIKSSIQKVVGVRANCPKNITNMQFAEKGATKTLESRKNKQQIERGSSLKIDSNMQQVVGKRDSRFLENMSNSELEIMSDDSETEEPSDLNIDETQDDAGSASKKTRGRTRLQLLHLQKELIQVELNVLRQPIGEPGHKLGQYIGFIVSDSAIAPLTFEDWRYMPKETKIHMYDIIKAKFNINWDLAEDWINKKLSHLWRQRKHRLKKKYEKSSNDKEKLSELINDVGKEQWNLLVEFWNSEKGKNRSETNKTNYGKMTMHHTGGTKSFARLRDELRRMDELITNQPDASKNEVFNQVIGEVSPEAHVSTLTYGLGINQSKKNGKRSSHLDTLKMLEDERIQRQTANEKITHLQSELIELKSQLQTMEEMKSQFVQFKSMFEHQFSNSNASS